MRCQTLRSCGSTLKRLKRDLDSTKPVESGELHPQRGILEGNRLVAVQQESNESNETQQKVWHGAQIVGFDCLQSQGVIGGRNNGDAQVVE